MNRTIIRFSSCKKLILMSLIAISISNIYSMEETDKGDSTNRMQQTTNAALENNGREDNIINTNNVHPVTNVIHDIDNREDNVINTNNIHQIIHDINDREENIINTNNVANVLFDNDRRLDNAGNDISPIAKVINNIKEEEKSNDYKHLNLNIQNLFNNQALQASMQASIDNIIKNSIKELQNSIVCNSNNKTRSIITSNIDKHPTDYKQQKPVEFSVIKNQKYNNEYEKFLFSIDDSNTIFLNNEENINKIQNDIDEAIKDVILDRQYWDDTLYKHKTTEEKINSLAKVLIKYYEDNASSIFNINNNRYINNNCIANVYEPSKIYIPFKLLQIMYNSLKKYDYENKIAEKVINKVYNDNRDSVHNYFKEIYNKQEFEPEEHKKTRGFLGNYSINKIPTHRELDIQKGNYLADYWEYANRNHSMFPSINVQYTDEYLQEAYTRYQDNIQSTLSNIIKYKNNNKPIDNIINYYSRVANRAPNVYLSNDVIDFIHKKLGINDVIYFIDKFINIKQQYLTEDDLPQNPEYFPNLLNEYPNGNLKDYNINIYTPNCIACIFNSSDQCGDGVAGANRRVINNNKEALYNSLVDANATFNPPIWRINKYSKVNNENNKEYKTVFLYYIK